MTSFPYKSDRWDSSTPEQDLEPRQAQPAAKARCKIVADVHSSWTCAGAAHGQAREAGK